MFSAGWSLYGDHKEYKLTGKNKLSKETKNEVARCILFLKSNLEYQWPHVPLKTRFIYAITFSVFGTNTQKQWKKVGDVSIWPFIKQSQLKHAKQRHGYLGISNT